MITFETQEDFEEAVLNIISRSLLLKSTNSNDDYYSKNETFSIELVLENYGAGINISPRTSFYHYSTFIL